MLKMITAEQMRGSFKFSAANTVSDDKMGDFPRLPARHPLPTITTLCHHVGVQET